MCLEGFSWDPLYGYLRHFAAPQLWPRSGVRGVFAGGFGTGFLLVKVKGQRVPCRFCGSLDGDGHLFWERPFPPLVEIREHPKFHDLMEMDKSSWPRCLLWHGWLPLLSGVNGSSPWAGSCREGAANLLECAVGRYSSDALTGRF